MKIVAYLPEIVYEFYFFYTPSSQTDSFCIIIATGSEMFRLQNRVHLNFIEQLSLLPDGLGFLKVKNKTGDMS